MPTKDTFSAHNMHLPAECVKTQYYVHTGVGEGMIAVV